MPFKPKVASISALLALGTVLPLMTKLQGLIPAAGKGVRARPYTHDIHKGMLDIHGSPNIGRVVGIMRDQMGIEEIVIVVGYLGDSIKAYFGDGSDFGVSIKYVENHDLDKGLAWSVLLGGNKITADNFCIMLCDECYIASNHNELLQHPYQESLVTCCGLSVDDNNLIQRNFSVHLDSNRHVQSLQEKPQIVTSRIMGTGTFLCHRDLFKHLQGAFDNSKGRGIDFVSTLNRLHQKQSCLGFFEIKGTYVNINDRDSLYLAKYHERKRSMHDCSLALIIYSDGAEENIHFTIENYADLDLFQSMSVVLPADNEIEDKVNALGARVIRCPQGVVGYGEKLRYALLQTTEDIIVFTEADYSFSARDVDKLLTYLPESDMVLGSRTTRQLIEQGSNMRGLVRLAHATLGRMIELLWWNRRSRFTDVGCTFRAAWKSSLDLVINDLGSDGPEFSAEMMIEFLRQHQRVIEVPVNYFNKSQELNKRHQTAATFFRFLKLIISRRLYPPQKADHPAPFHGSEPGTGLTQD